MRLTPTTTRALLDRYDVRPTKRLGQHFLIDPNIVDRIVRTVGGGPGDPVIEIGAGLGTLTAALVKAGYEVVSYEVDRRLKPILDEVVGGGAVIRLEDAAQVDLAAVLDDRSWVMAANLPYNVGTPLLLDALRQAPQIHRFVVMLQAEVVDRLAASSGDAAYGLPSVVVGLYAAVRDRFSVPAQVFHPRPSVESAVVVLDRIVPDPSAEAAVELASRAFGQRRKMLRSSLREVVTESQFERSGIEATARPEELSPRDWIALAETAA